MATFFVLAGLMRFAKFKLPFWMDFILLFSFGLLIEFTQQFIPLRSLDIFDMLANALGLVLFYLLYFGFIVKRIKN